MRPLVRWTMSLLGVALVWATLVAPDDAGRLSPGSFARIPIEGILIVAVALVLPLRGRRVLAVAAGLVLAALTIMRVFDVGFRLTLGRPFNPLTDWGYFHSAEGLLRQSVGWSAALAVLVSVAVGALALLVLLPLAVLEVARLAAAHRAVSNRAIAGLAALWGLCASLALQAAPGGASVASAATAEVAVSHVRQVGLTLGDRHRFAAAAAHDNFRATPGDALLTGLRGKDVLFVFVESYGRVALDGPASASVRAALDAGTNRLHAAGYSARSAYLTSPTFGGLSWLAHSTLQSGLWVDDQRRYDTLMRSNRLTLSVAFHRAGWRTVGDVPSNEQAWADGSSFYHYDRTYGAHDVGYAGPAFSYASMPDQYVLSAFQRLELTRPDRPPVMAEIDLVSSHTPWAPLPRLVAWNRVGDGSVFDPMPAQGRSPAEVWRDAPSIGVAYAQSIVYSLDALVSFVQHSADPNLVVVALGDHQPATVVSGRQASSQVPITVIARDPAVLHRIDGWSWDSGLRPGSAGPVWPMDAFRDRFLSAYGPRPLT